jgi:hypothetical protein
MANKAIILQDVMLSPFFWLVNDWLSLGISKEYMSRSKCSFPRKQLTPGKTARAMT